MIDPKVLKEGQQIVLRQNKINGKWQEFIIDKNGRILAVEDVKLFEKSKLEATTPNNYEELKKNYKYLSKTEQSPPPISINEDLPELDNKELEPPEVEHSEHEYDRECPTAPSFICGSSTPDYPEIEEEPEEVGGKEPDPEVDRDIDQEIKEQEKERDCEVKESEEKK